MKNASVLSLAAGLMLFGSACSNSPQPGASPTPPPIADAVPPPSAKPEMHLYTTTVDNLNLRDQPNKAGQVITQLKEGDFVESTGEISPNKEKATLRGIQWEEPYYKVVSTTPEQRTGWAYGGALQRVYSGPRATSPDLGKLTQLSMQLKALDTKKLDSGKQAWNFVQSNFAGTKGTTADAAFLILEHFLSRMEMEGEFYKLTEKVKWADEDYQSIAAGTFNPNKNPVTKSIHENGFALSTGEGMVFPVVDWKKLSDFFADKVTPPMKSYLLQNAMENMDNAMDDGGFALPMPEIADRAAFWEKFNLDHPYFVRHEETMESQRWLRHALTNGADNTPVFTGEGGEVNPEFADMWKYVQQKYAGTAIAKRVKEFSDLVTTEGGKRTKKVEELQQKYNEEMAY